MINSGLFFVLAHILVFPLQPHATVSYQSFLLVSMQLVTCSSIPSWYYPRPRTSLHLFFFSPFLCHSLCTIMTQVGETFASNASKTITTKGSSASTAKFVQRASKFFYNSESKQNKKQQQHFYAQVKSCPATPRSTKKQILIRAVRTPSPNTVKVKKS